VVLVDYILWDFKFVFEYSIKTKEKNMPPTKITDGSGPDTSEKTHRSATIVGDCGIEDPQMALN
jgi:hypothetical protein